MLAFEDGEVSVDQDFARFGSKSYAINKINTVDVRERKPNKIFWPILSGLVALIQMVGVATDLAHGEILSAGVRVLVAVGLGWLTFWLWKRSQVIEYQLFLMTSSSEVQAYATRDRTRVMQLRNAIERAMARVPA